MSNGRVSQAEYTDIRWVTLTQYIHKLDFIYLFIYLFILGFRDRVSLCSAGFPGTLSVDQADLELRELPVSASWMLELKVYATISGDELSFKELLL